MLAKPTKPVRLGTSPPSWTQLMCGHLDRPGEGSGLPQPGFGVTYSTTLTTTTTTGKRVYQHCWPTFSTPVFDLPSQLVHSPSFQIQLAKDKLDATRLENLTDSEEAFAEMNRKHSREKLLLLEENKKLIHDLETVSDNYSTINISLFLILCENFS